MNRLSSTQNLLKDDKTYSFGGQFSTLIPPEQRGFVSNIVESWKRGDEQILSDIAVYEAMRDGKNIDDALNLRRKYLRKEIVDPIQGNFISNLVYKGIKILPGWFRSGKEAIGLTLAGAGTGAAIAGIAGQLGPQAALPEEIATVPAGAITGAKVGFTMGNALFWYKQGAGSMYADMIDKGYDPAKSWKIAQVAAVPYAALEFFQIKAASPAFKKGLQEVLNKSSRSIIRQFGKSYLSKLGKEVGEEVAQEAVQIVAEDVSSYASKMGVPINKDYFKERAFRLGNVAWQSTQAMALLPIPGAAIETGVKVSAQKAFDIAKEEESKQRWEGLTGETYGEEPISAEATKGIDPLHIGYSQPVQIYNDGRLVTLDYSQSGLEAARIEPTDALGKLQFALMRSTDKYREMKLKHKEELADKFSRAESIMKDSPTAREGLKKARSKMAGKLTELNIEPVEYMLSGNDWESIFSEIRETSRLKTAEKINLSNALENLLKEGRLLRPNEVKLFGKQFGPLMEQAMNSLSDVVKNIPKTKEQKAADILGIPKATSASMDISRTFRQNILLIGNPKAFFKGWMDEVKLFTKDEASAKSVELAAMTGPYSSIWRRTPLRINEWGEKGTYRTRAERFPTQKLAKVPWISRSERAYTIGGNLIRIYLFEQIAKEWENNPNQKYTQKDYNDLAHIINMLTGEGDATLFGEHAGIINALFFAPRLLVSRFQAILASFNPQRSVAARKVLASHLVKFVAVNSLVLGLLSTIPGVTVEKDPRSTDFGKVKYGNTRIEFWGGYLPIVRMVTELATGKHKTQSGNIVNTQRQETIQRFLQSKLAPVPAAMLDFMRGETFYGQEIKKDSDSLLFEAYTRLTPFIIQDIIDALQYQGIGAAALAAPLAFHGIGVQSYDQTPGTKVTIMKDKIAQEVFGQRWGDIGNEAQKVLREYYPEIGNEEAKLNYEYQSPKYVEKIIRDEYKSEQRILKNLSPSITKQLSDNKVKIGGLGRRVGSDWYLNDKRFNEYEKLTTKLLNDILPVIFKMPEFDRLLFSERQLVIGDIIAEIKSEVRKHIIQKADKKDFEYLWQDSLRRRK